MKNFIEIREGGNTTYVNVNHIASIEFDKDASVLHLVGGYEVRTIIPQMQLIHLIKKCDY